ncbi:MAG: hemerythrin family protein [Gallionellaceae bacterium]|jgi:hemerythrin
MKLEWREQLSVGNNVIDADHKYLIELINQIQVNLKAKNREELKKLLDDLSRYSLVHFDREEKIAIAAGYDRASILHISHEELIKQLDQVKAEINTLGQEWSAEVTTHFTQFLHDWLINHVIKEDLLMRPYLKKFSASFDLH